MARTESQSGQTTTSAPTKYLDVARQMKGLVQAFSFDNETLLKPDGKLGFGGNVATDLSGQGSSGVMGGPERGVLGAMGIAGEGLEFFGASHLLFKDSQLPKGAESRSVSLWIKAGPQKNNGGTVFKYGGGAGNGIVLFVFPDDSPNAYGGRLTLSQEGDVAPDVNLATTAMITDGKWHHVVITMDKGFASVFVDGSKQGGKSLQKETQLTGNAIIGNLGPEDGLHGFNGVVDEFAIFSRALAEAEVRELFMAGRQ
jgi:hypothetical protein